MDADTRQNTITLPGQAFLMDTLHSGDHVLLCVSDTDMPVDRITTMMESLRERFPDVDFTIVAGVSGVVVVPAYKHEDSAGAQ